MKVKCVANTGEALTNAHFKIGHLREHEYEVSVGEVYIVYGVNVWHGLLNYLVVPEKVGIARWIPSVLFEVLDSRFPPFWRFGFLGTGSEYTLYAVWGYPELLDVAHYSGLLDLEPIDLDIFYRWRQHTDWLYDDRFVCRVCGHRQSFMPWGKSGNEPSFEFCPCCAVVFGNEDCTPSEVRKYRQDWRDKGCPFFLSAERVRLADAQITGVPTEYR